MKIKLLFALFLVVSLCGCVSRDDAKLRIIKSNPVGAEIFVNGQAVGKAPVVYRFAEVEDAFEVEAKLPGYVREFRVYNDPENDLIPNEILFVMRKAKTAKK